MDPSKKPVTVRQCRQVAALANQSALVNLRNKLETVDMATQVITNHLSNLNPRKRVKKGSVEASNRREVKESFDNVQQAFHHLKKYAESAPNDLAKSLAPHAGLILTAIQGELSDSAIVPARSPH